MLKYEEANELRFVNIRTLKAFTLLGSKFAVFSVLSSDVIGVTSGHLDG